MKMRFEEERCIDICGYIAADNEVKALFTYCLTGRCRPEGDPSFPHFLIRFTRTIQPNATGWDALFSYALVWVKANWKTNEYNEEKIAMYWALVCKMTIFAASWGSNPDSAREVFLIQNPMATLERNKYYGRKSWFMHCVWWVYKKTSQSFVP